MTRVFLDSNIWLRALMDQDEPANQCRQLFTHIDHGTFIPHTSTVVLIEVNYVLLSFYKIKPKEVNQNIQQLLKTKNLILIEKTNFPRSLALSQQTSIKLTDCIIATQIPPKTIAVTYDKHFTKFPNVTTKTPGQLVKKLSLD